MRRLDYCWRVLATGWAFAFVFFGGGLLAATILPLISILPGHSRRRSQWLIHRAFHFFVGAMQRIGLLTLDVRNKAKLKDCAGTMVVANHPSLLDVVFLMALIPRAQCIIKHELWSHPLLGRLMRGAGYLRNDLPAEDMLAQCRAALDAGDCLIVFPEGTRTTPGSPPAFRRGFGNVALLAGAPIQPVVITCRPQTLIKGEKWWQIPPRKPLFTVTIGDKLDASQYLAGGGRGLAVRRLVRDLERYYRDRLLEDDVEGSREWTRSKTS